MTGCDPQSPAPTDAPANSGLVVGRDPAALVVDRSARVVYTTRCECDARTALSRAVADYVASLSIAGPGGRAVSLAAVHAEWAEPDERAVFPYACVDAAGDQAYDSNSFTPGVGLAPQVHLPPDTYLVHTSNLAVAMRVGVWATDNEERSAIVRALEDAMWPVEFMGGFRLDMPHYFGARAEFVARRATYADDEVNSLRGYRRATITLDASGPVIRLKRIPRMTVKTQVTVVNPTAGG